MLLMLNIWPQTSTYTNLERRNYDCVQGCSKRSANYGKWLPFGGWLVIFAIFLLYLSHFPLAAMRSLGLLRDHQWFSAGKLWGSMVASTTLSPHQNQHGKASHWLGPFCIALWIYPLVICYIANWKIHYFLMGKSTISMAIFNSYVTNYQRVPFVFRGIPWHVVLLVCSRHMPREHGNWSLSETKCAAT